MAFSKLTSNELSDFLPLHNQIPLINAQPSIPLIHPKPSGPPLINAKPSIPLINVKPNVPLINDKPSGPPLINPKPSAPLINPKPSAPLINPKPSGSLIHPKPSSAPLINPKPSAPLINPKPSASLINPSAPLINPSAPLINARPSESLVVSTPSISSGLVSIIKPNSLWNWSVLDGEAPIPIKYPVILKYQIEAIEEWRKWIGVQSNVDPNGDFRARDLKVLFNLYNEYFFNGSLPSRVSLELSDRLSKTAGLCSRGSGECEYKIIIARNLFQNLSLLEGQATQSGGITCRTSLQCLQLTFEHELIHLMIKDKRLDYRNSDQKIYGPHGQLFKDLIYAYFGQTRTTHNIGRIILSDETNEPLQKENATIGRPVSYFIDGKLYKGVITRPSRTNAKILLLDRSSSSVRYEFLYIINDADEDLEALTELSHEIVNKLNYYHTLREGDSITFIINGTVKTDTIRKLRPRSYKLDTSNYRLSYTVLIPNASVQLKGQMITKNDLTIADTIGIKNGTFGVIIKKNPTTVLIYDNNKRLMVVPYSLIRELLPSNEKLKQEFVEKRNYFAQLVPGQEIKYDYFEKGRHFVTRGTVIKKKLDTLMVTFSSNLNCVKNIHYMDLIL
jgi:hypothetical protein